jgi:hypothetical protein
MPQASLPGTQIYKGQQQLRDNSFVVRPPKSPQPCTVPMGVWLPKTMGRLTLSQSANAARRCHTGLMAPTTASTCVRTRAWVGLTRTAKPLNLGYCRHPHNWIQLLKIPIQPVRKATLSCTLNLAPPDPDANPLHQLICEISRPKFQRRTY